MKFPALLSIVLTWAGVGAPLQAETAARTIAYHNQDIVNIRARVKYTTLIQLPNTEKIIEAATGDKEFWIIDVVGSFCHSGKATIRPGNESALKQSLRSHPWLGLPGWTCVCFAFTISRMTIIKTPTRYLACASFVTTAATLSSIWFQPSI